MTLTEEQKQRMEQNRLRALEIQRQRRLQQEQEQQLLQQGDKDEQKSPPLDERDASGKRHKKEPNDENNHTNENKKDNNNNDNNDDEEEEEEELEDFEQGASDLVTKREAMQMYCLPEGTLAVCTFVEKENPHRKGWTPMKLYHRHELRKRARKRFGGLQGLIDERKKRQERQFQKDMERSKQIFQTTNNTATTTKKRKK